VVSELDTMEFNFVLKNWFDSLNFDLFCTIQSVGKQNGTCDGGKKRNKILDFLLALRY
jgi:hypothetical protein